ncbi:hypothetical protein [Lentzea albidocapillata]|uniref:hypothetical protein n=1 Tax=Lentzea albidocapillata TaxID=40571 RepID=UPI0004C3307B|nr:hypothetical protein [Lentzea albidocapillata]
MNRTPIFDELYAKYVATPARGAMAPQAPQWPGETDEVLPACGSDVTGSLDPAGSPSHRRPM